MCNVLNSSSDHGCETLTVRKKDERKIQTTEMRFARNTEGETQRENIRNVVIRDLAQVQQAAV